MFFHQLKPDEEFINHSILNLAEFLTLSEMEVSVEDSPLRLTFAHNAVDCLMVALTGNTCATLVFTDEPRLTACPIAKPTAAETSQQFFPNPSIFTTRLLNLLSVGQKADCATTLSEERAQKMISNSLAVLIEASVHDSAVWNILKENTRIEDSVFDLLLTEQRQGVRKEVAGIISRLCRGGHAQQKQASGAKIDGDDNDAVIRLLNPTTIDIVGTLWKAFLSLFPKTLDFPTSSQEFFEVALVVFQTVSDLSPDDLVIGEYILEWGGILLKHRTREVSLKLRLRSSMSSVEVVIWLTRSSSLVASGWIISFWGLPCS